MHQSSQSTSCNHLNYKCCRLLQVLVVSSVLIACFYPEVADAGPAYESWSVYKAAQVSNIGSPHRNECEILTEVQTLCQQCAKHTKSNVVYPLCCEDRVEARPWCQRFVSYGQD